MKTPWIAYHRPQPRARLRLFCFPYAGGGASLFVPWVSALAPEIEVCAVQPPGRENRLQEPLLRRVDKVADLAAAALRPWLDRPFAFFGHSLGSIVAFETAQRLGADGPRELIASGRRGPAVPFHSELTYALPQAEFERRLRTLNGTPPAVLANRELMELMTPVVRADFELDETYDAARQHVPLACPITAYGGRRDAEVPPEDLDAWRAATSSDFRARWFDGDHFFLQSERDKVIAALREDLTA